MLSCYIETYPSYRIKVTGDLELLEACYDFFQSHKIVKFPEWRYGKRMWQTEKVEVNLTERFERKTQEPYLILHRGYFTYLVLYLHELKQKYDITYSTTVNPYGELQLCEKWQAILRDYQVAAFNKICKLKGAIAQMPTGRGKSEIFISILESYLLHDPSHKCVILIPKNSIIEEITERFNKYNIGEYITNDRVKLINPMGYNRSKLANNIEMNNWLNGVGMCILDEIHHANCASYVKIFNKMRNLEYSIGFSATVSTHRLNKVLAFRGFPYEAQYRIGLTGPSSVFEFAKDVGKKINYYQVEGNFGGGNEKDANDYFKTVKTLSRSKEFLRIINKIITMFGNKVFYIPIPHIEAGENIYNYLSNQGIKCIHWVGGYTGHPKHIKSLSDIKNAIKNDGYRCIIGTVASSEGVSLDGIEAVVLSVGRDSKMVPQTVGRAGRQGEVATVFNIYNVEQSMMLNQARQRHSAIMLNYDCEPKKLIITS